jgi:hypothetical protein
MDIVAVCNWFLGQIEQAAVCVPNAPQELRAEHGGVYESQIVLCQHGQRLDQTRMRAKQRIWKNH